MLEVEQVQPLDLQLLEIAAAGGLAGKELFTWPTHKPSLHLHCSSPRIMRWVTVEDSSPQPMMSKLWHAQHCKMSFT